jgi:pantothenate kinase
VDGTLAERARELARAGGRRILGLAGPPGAGKSTLARALADTLGGEASMVGMDGFHLAGVQLERLGLADRKGAPETFDLGGYLTLLARLRDPGGRRVVYAPEFRRRIEEPVAAAVAIPPDVPLVITEGNYLLHDRDGWEAVRTLLDEAWYVHAPDDLRIERLVARHQEHGRSPEEARVWALGSDQDNAALVEETRHRADHEVSA